MWVGVTGPKPRSNASGGKRIAGRQRTCPCGGARARLHGHSFDSKFVVVPRRSPVRDYLPFSPITWTLSMFVLLP